VFAETINAIRLAAAATTVEVLIPDFLGSLRALEVVVAAKPEVINHNMETVPRLYPVVRRGADYARSLQLLRRVTQLNPGIITKSGIMVGMGETMGEVLRVVQDLVDAGCQALTVGQYLRPTLRNYPVQRFVSPEEFDEIESMALALGMTKVAAGPLVRSSYRAGEVFGSLRASRQETVLD
jgi:lipoic acid synthetase